MASQELARLITGGEDGTPHVGLFPFVYDGSTVAFTSSARTSSDGSSPATSPKAAFVP